MVKNAIIRARPSAEAKASLISPLVRCWDMNRGVNAHQKAKIKKYVSAIQFEMFLLINEGTIMFVSFSNDIGTSSFQFFIVQL